MPVADTLQRDSSTGGNTVIFVRAPSASDVEGPSVSKDQTDANPATEDGSQAEPALPPSTKPAGADQGCCCSCMQLQWLGPRDDSKDSIQLV
jgi:hypothetical protein